MYFTDCYYTYKQTDTCNRHLQIDKTNKVMQIKNNYDLQWERDNGENGFGVFNGDVGYITHIVHEKREFVKISLTNSMGYATIISIAVPLRTIPKRRPSL